MDQPASEGPTVGQAFVYDGFGSVGYVPAHGENHRWPLNRLRSGARRDWDWRTRIERGRIHRRNLRISCDSDLSSYLRVTVLLGLQPKVVTARRIVCR